MSERIKTCPVCGKVFVRTKGKRQDYCSVECRNEKKREREKAYGGYRYFTCVECGLTVKRTRSNSIYCPECQAKITEKNKQRQRIWNNYNDERKQKRAVSNTMKDITVGVIDDWSAEAKAKGMSYGELKAKKALEKAGAIKL